MFCRQWAGCWFASAGRCLRPRSLFRSGAIAGLLDHSVVSSDECRRHTRHVAFRNGRDHRRQVERVGPAGESEHDQPAHRLLTLVLRPQGGVAGVGYWTVPSQRGQGHAPRAVALVSRWALADAGPARVEAWVESHNAASQHVLTAAGFEHEGTLRSFLSFPTRRSDAMVFSIVASH